jgi:hypothetical protein
MKKPLELAIELATYGLYGAGADETPEQKEWGADCVEAAILLFKTTRRKRLRVCDQFLDASALETLAKGLRNEAEELRHWNTLTIRKPFGIIEA